MANKKVYTGTGRRKSSIAQVKMVPGKGKITVNGRDVRDFFPYETNVMDLKQPLVATNNEETFDIDVKVNGGGFTGQTGAIRLGISILKEIICIYQTKIYFLVFLCYNE